MDILTIATSVLGSLFGGGLVSALVTQQMSAAREERNLLRGKLEQTFIAASKYAGTTIGLGNMFSLYYEGKMTFEETKVEAARHENHYESKSQLQMLCNVYFPDLLPSLKELVIAQESIKTGGVIFEQPTVINTQLAESILTQLQAFNLAVANFNAKINGEGLKIK